MRTRWACVAHYVLTAIIAWRDVHLARPQELARLREETATMSGAQMQVSPEQGAFMALLASILGARRYLEIGVYTGYSLISVAKALERSAGAHVRAVALDSDARALDVARRFCAKAGLESVVDFRVGKALETLPGVATDYGDGAFDFAFIGAAACPPARNCFRARPPALPARRAPASADARC